MGLIAAWFVAYPLYLAICTWRTLPVIGVRLGTLVRAIAAPGLAAAAMGLLVAGLDHLLPPMAPVARLGLLVTAGGAAYGALLLLFARTMLFEVIALVRNRAG